MISKFLKNHVQFIFLVICFLFFVPNFFCNYWGISNSHIYYSSAEGDISVIKDYDPHPSMLIIGRLAESKKHGVFSHAGLPGINFDKKNTPENIVSSMFEENPRYYILHYNIVREYTNYMNEKDPAPDFCAYASQVGGQGIVYSLINNILPFSNQTNYNLLKLLNAVLVSLAFIIFLGWCFRNFGLVASSITFVLIILTPWLTLLGGSLWWSIWGLYIPFLVTLLVVERKFTSKSEMKERFIVFMVFIAVSLKCFFTGMEFITSSLLAIYCPIVYYFWQKEQKISTFIYFSFKVGIAAILAVFLNLMVLLLQLKSVMGGWGQALDYVEFAFLRRTVPAGVPSNIFEIVIKKYLKLDAFNWGVLQEPYIIRYLYVIGIVLVLSALFFICFRKIKEQRKYVSLGITTVFSILSPLSWYFIFAQHSDQHKFYDNLVWYMPFLLYGYLTISAGISLLYNKYFKKLKTL